MAPKGKDKGKGAQEEVTIETINRPNILDTMFPPWNEADIAADKVDPKAESKFEDHQGLLLPDAIRPFLDTWKRPDELVLGQPDIPITTLASVEIAGKPVLGGPKKRDVEGKLFAGNRGFDWIYHVLLSIQDLAEHMEPGNYLWELIYPQNKDKMPEKRPDGKFFVKCFIMDKWRRVTIDDRMPVDLFGTPLPVGIRPLQLWPLILSKAIMKVMSAYKLLDGCLPDNVPAFQWLTGWPQENLRDLHSGTPFSTGALFDRIEESVKPFEADPAQRSVMTTCCLIDRAQPERPPPRIIVLYGPSGVGVGRVLDKIVEYNPVTLDRTVSTTTRFPKEHEIEGKDYTFSNLENMRKAIENDEFLEYSYVMGTKGRYLYGSSLATVRTVAAAGKLCCMRVDPQGIKTLQKTPGVDGLYVYVAPPSFEELEARCRGRLKEAESTIQKRLTWAQDQVKLSEELYPTPGKPKNPMVDFIIDNTTIDYAYNELLEAICTLSPIIRNRIRGLPAYVLAYSDLIPSNSVEKPFLKPIMIAGPTCTEKTELIHMLVKEFPDVFGFATLTTTQREDEWEHRVADDFDVRSMYANKARSMVGSQHGSRLSKQSGKSGRSGRGSMKGASKAQRGGAGLPGIKENSDVMDGGSRRASSDLDISKIPYELEPKRDIVTDEEFDRMVSNGEFLEHHKDLFKHEKITRKWGTSHKACEEVIANKKLILIDCDMEGLKMVRSGGHDCLTIFLNPESIEEFERRVRSWLSYSDAEITGIIQRAREADALVKSSGLFDYTLVNKQLEMTTDKLQELISANRPDLIPPRSEEDTSRVPYLVISGARGWGYKEIMARMVTDMADSVKVAVSMAVRKPKEGEEEGVHYKFQGKADAFKKMLEKGEILADTKRGGEKDAVFYGVPRDAIEEGKAAGKICAMKVDPEGAASIRAMDEFTGRRASPLFIYIAPPSLEEARKQLQEKYELEEEELEAAMEELQKEIEAARVLPEDGGAFDVVLENESTDVVYTDIKNLLAKRNPSLVKPPLKPLVVCGPFGTGKRMLLQRLLDEFLPRFEIPKSATTRAVDEAESTFFHMPSELLNGQIEAGKFLTHETANGVTYGLRSLEVRAVQGTGNICVVEADGMAEVQQMMNAGLEANYIFVAPANLEAMQDSLRHSLLRNPPLGYEPMDAANSMAEIAKKEVDEAYASQAFDFFCEMIQDDDEGSYSRLLHAVSQCYPEYVPPRQVWGFGRQLWDNDVRVYGEKPLKIMVLGPALVGKSSLCARLSEEFGVPWVDAGVLLQQEIKAKTPLGLRAKKYIDVTKTVPDDIFIQLTTARLAEEDCRRAGWLLDGFPHSYGQIAMLKEVGILPDKVIFLEGTHRILCNRALFRKLDPETQKTYHVPNPEEKTKPLEDHIHPEDKEIEERLVIRHDDGEENVQNRLKFWDDFYADLRKAYANVSMTLSGEGGCGEIADKSMQFLKVEDIHLTDISVMLSKDLRELQYQIVRTLKWRQRQLVQLRQNDGKRFWVDLAETSANTSSIIIQGLPSLYKTHVEVVRPEPYSLQREALLLVESPEPIRLLTSLASGPQSLVEDPVPAPLPPIPLVLVGPEGVGKSMLMQRLLEDLPDKVVVPAWHTTRPPTEFEKEEGIACGHIFVEEDEFGLILDKDGFVLSDYEGEFMTGLSKSTLSALAKEGKIGVLEMETEEALALKKQGVVACFMLVLPQSLAALDCRLRDNRVMEEADLQAALRDARVQMDSAGEWEHVIVNGASMEAAALALKEAVSNAWPRILTSVTHHLMLKDYTWGAPPAAGAVQHRVQHIAANSALLNLPRGKHLLRLEADPDNVYAVNVRSNTPFKLADFSDILKEDIDLETTHWEGTYPAMEGGASHLWFRQDIQFAEQGEDEPPQEDPKVAAVINLGDLEMLPYCQLRLMDNDTLTDTTFLAGRMEPRKLKRNAKGYTLMALSHLCRPSAICGAEFRVSISCTEPRVTATEALHTRVEKFQGTYKFNKQLVLSRHVIASSSPDAISVLVAEVSSKPQTATGLVMKLLKVAAKDGKAEEIQWGAEEEEINRWAAYDRIMVPAVALPALEPGFVYVLQLSLDPGALPFESIYAGEIPGAEIQWFLQMMPNEEEAKLVVSADTCMERHAVALLQKWNEQGAGGLKDRPGNAQRVYEEHFAPPPAEGAEGEGEPEEKKDTKKDKKDDKGAKKKGDKGGDKPAAEERKVDPEKFTKTVGAGAEAKRPVGQEDWQKRMESIKASIKAFKEQDMNKFKQQRKEGIDQRSKAAKSQSSVVQQLRSSNIKGVKVLEAKRAHLVKEAAKEVAKREAEAEAARLAELGEEAPAA